MDMNNYIKERLDNQINWYDRKSMINKKYFICFQVIQILFSSLIPILSLLSVPYIKITIAICGAIVSISSSIQNLNKFHENWIEYRMVAETLKHEKYLFLTKSGIYSDDKINNNLLVERIENIISHENINWSQITKKHLIHNTTHSSIGS